ncbi:hypothetical protein Tco_1525483 [Tanacetum coccineum]
MTNTQTPPTATTVVNTTGAPVTNTVANHAEKPEKFNETGSSARLDDNDLQDERQRDDNDLQMRDKIKPRKKKLNQEEAKGQETRNC